MMLQCFSPYFKMLSSSRFCAMIFCLHVAVDKLRSATVNGVLFWGTAMWNDAAAKTKSCRQWQPYWYSTYHLLSQLCKNAVLPFLTCLNKWDGAGLYYFIAMKKHVFIFLKIKPVFVFKRLHSKWGLIEKPGLSRGHWKLCFWPPCVHCCSLSSWNDTDIITVLRIIFSQCQPRRPQFMEAWHLYHL